MTRGKRGGRKKKERRAGETLFTFSFVFLFFALLSSAIFAPSNNARRIFEFFERLSNISGAEYSGRSNISNPAKPRIQSCLNYSDGYGRSNTSNPNWRAGTKRGESAAVASRTLNERPALTKKLCYCTLPQPFPARVPGCRYLSPLSKAPS